MASPQDIGMEAVKSAPPVAVTGYAIFSGLTLNDWVAIATLFYIGLQVYFLIRKEWREKKADDANDIDMGV